ncbi:MAG: M28 family peptidase [Flavobacteriaceae bacterium]|nr:M28 family peptidase [Flavobacteriaceae bacterium]
MKKKKIALIISLFLIGTLVNAIGHPILLIKEKQHNIKINKDNLLEDVKQLAATPQARNHENIASLNQAAQYIADEFSDMGLAPVEQTYKLNGQEYKNIIAFYGPEQGKRIVIGAHYDVCGEQQGADDNASGVAGLLEIARQFQEHKPDTAYRFEFVAYTLEEPPYFRTENMGSHVHAKSLIEDKVEVEAMISLEMIGYFSEEKNSQDYPIGILKWFYPTKANYIAVVGKLGKGKLTRKIKKGIKKGSPIEVRSINAPASVVGIDFSDHLNYWKYDFNAIMVTDTSFFRNANYHQKTDTPETLDYDKMTEVVQGVTYALFNYE